MGVPINRKLNFWYSSVTSSTEQNSVIPMVFQILRNLFPFSEPRMDFDLILVISIIFINRCFVSPTLFISPTLYDIPCGSLQCTQTDIDTSVNIWWLVSLLWPLLLTRINFNPSIISNHMPNNVWDEITYPLPNFNGATVEVWKWISNFIPRFIVDVITYPCWD